MAIIDQFAAPAPAPLMAGKRGLIMGVANDHSIAWGIARMLHAHGAELAFTYQGEAFGRRVKPLADSVHARLNLPCDVGSSESLAATFDRLGEAWGGLDFVIHSIAYSDKSELKGRYVDTSRENFLRTLEISCYSLTAIAQRAAPMMVAGGAIVTLTYLGAERVMPNYNVMGVAKAALEASVRYLATDLGSDAIRVNAISAGPMRTLAGSAIGAARTVFKVSEQNAPLGRNGTLDEVAGAALFLVSDLGTAVTGEVLHVDGGYHVLGMGRLGAETREGELAAK